MLIDFGVSIPRFREVDPEEEFIKFLRRDKPKERYKDYLQNSAEKVPDHLKQAVEAIAFGITAVKLDVSPEEVKVSADFERALVAYFAAHPSEMKTMNRRLFEELVAELWDGFGYEVELTQRTRDGGKDIIAVRHAHVSERFLIECKRPDPGNPIGVQTVRELFGVKTDDGATKAILATTSYFSPDAKQFFERHKWELEGKDYEGLVGWLRLAANESPQTLPLRRIVSGGQTGADRAGLDWAIEHNIPHGGYCPKGRLAEDGAIPLRYRLTETPTKDYPARTERNARESDGTIIFTMGPELQGGSKLTAAKAERHGKPYLHVWASAPRDVTVAAVRSFVATHRISVLNVAGSRGSNEPEVGAFVREILSLALLS
jgi:hypothetical protein